jgi:hypothetical protein
LAEDVHKVTGKTPAVKASAPESKPSVIIIGTLGKNASINQLVSQGKIKVGGLQGKWESYLAMTIARPFPGVENALVIVGSDRRGTAYGAFALSEAIGVSPWCWWADVTPRHRDALFVRAGICASKEPSVQYRGIFINDEDWGLQPWAAKNFEPEVGDIGPKTYARVFELLLRLKANYLWPGMHSCTKAFNIYPENKVVAENYAIVMGASHCEPLLRNNVTEWDTKTRGEWDYVKNRDNVVKYWEERVKENGKYENIYTVGMRGLHDSGMVGGGTTAEQVARLEKVFADQRDLLAQYVNSQVEKVPQLFVPYKEVLPLYQNGLKVPDDVTLGWVDDNHGYIRRLSNAEERKRSGGSGVYYHVSYWGMPEDYLWLCTTPPALIWEEMRKAYDNDARKVWVLNVGDIKPSEIDMEFFLRLAWDVNAWDENAQLVFLTDWAERNFGKENAKEIAAILDEYYRLHYAAKPEHLLKAKFTNNYNEKTDRMQRFAKLVERTNALYEKQPKELRDAFYQLLVYPVRCSALMNEKFLSDTVEDAQKAYGQIQTETKYYNEEMAAGKWRHMMSMAPRNTPVFKKPIGDEKNDATRKEASVDHGIVGDGYVSLEAEKPTRKTNGDGATWKIISGLGRSGDSLALLPTTAKVTGKATLEYDFTVTKSGDAKTMVYCVPTHAISSDVQLRYSVSIDSEQPQTVDIDTKEFSKSWSANVLNGAAIGTSAHKLAPGKHTLKITPLDPGIVFDKVVVDLGGLKPTHLGPPETAK